MAHAAPHMRHMIHTRARSGAGYTTGLLPRRRTARHGISMTALADVLFQLLIFFMLSANLSSYSMLPLRTGALQGTGGAQGGIAGTGAASTAVWTLNADGITASGQRFALTRLEALADALAVQGTPHVLLVLRPDVPVQDVVTVLEILSARGVTSVQIAQAGAGAGSGAGPI